MPRLLEELRIARGNGTHKRRLLALAKLDVLVLDDWALQPLETYGRDDLLELSYHPRRVAPPRRRRSPSSEYAA